MYIEITDKPIDPWTWLADQQAALIKQGELKATGFGACTSFIGTMRDFNEQLDVISMELVHYPGMTEKELHRLINKCTSKQAVLSASVIHRVGHIHPADAIVVVAVWSEHRKAAFEVCQGILEALKHRAPFWKNEVTAKGKRWVSKNSAA